MKVTELIIDGFKSYGQRTVIDGWDESFNSITGLNGSGKSNILDAICFVLGIMNMSLVRAANLQDLIYKRGQAGITKASVTIVFDNTDKSKSALAYKTLDKVSVTRQILLGGTSKYLINGARALQVTVHSLFQSVGLNINNPNFLIMQGKITSVLNMKPRDILSMLEEAAGTRMFEDRRDKAVKTIIKKDKKVEELNGLLTEEILPKLEKLRGEKRAFLEYQQAQSDMERLTKLVIAHDFLKNKDRLQCSVDDLAAIRQRVEDIDVATARMEREIEFIARETKRVKAERDEELRKGGRFQALEDEVKEKSHELIRIETQLSLKKPGIQESVANQKELEKTVKEYEVQLVGLNEIYYAAKDKYETAKAEYDALNAEAKEKEELLQILSTGVSSREGYDNGYQSQLQDARDRISVAKTEQQQAQLKISHFEQSVKEQAPRAKQAKEQNKALFQELDKLKASAVKVQAELQKTGYEEGKEEDLKRQELSFEKRIRELRDEADNLRRRVSNIDFNYSDPTPNFDRSKVKGLIAQLFTLDQSKQIAGTALEICAGGQLYNIVVDTAETASQLLQHGKLRKRVTIIPLNKIDAFRASAEKVATAQRLAPGKVELALTLIGFDDAIMKAMEFVFGSTLVCSDSEAAKRVTFDPNVRMRSVTYEGDIYNPSGILTGGSSPSSGGVLMTLQKLNELMREINDELTKLQSLREYMAGEKTNFDMARKLRQELEVKNHEIKLTEEQINSNSSSDIINAVEEMKENIKKCKQDIIDAKKRQQEAEKEAVRIEKDIDDFKNNKDSKLEELQNTVTKLQKQAAKISLFVDSLAGNLQDAQIEAEHTVSEHIGAQEKLAEIIETLESQRTEITELENEQSRIQKIHDVALAQLEDERKRIGRFEDELSDLEQTTRSKQTQISECALDKQKLGHEVEKLDQQRSTAKDAVHHLFSAYDWIEDEQDLFGLPGTPYDFKDQNMKSCRASMHATTDRVARMKKTVNPKVMSMIDQVEKKEAVVRNMLRTITKDKRKIEKTIDELDNYKRSALERTHGIVSGYFGEIFKEILPGNTAKLVPPEGKTVVEGLEVKVCLGGMWKEGLTELSGGQRSLIAISLIMSLLQYNPAPMYILDEVDSALDLSHTQNIGRLFRTRFKGSQFIVVSLKDGMFNNANRIFRAKFVDGISVVQVLR